jgi:hypothetical protein
MSKLCVVTIIQNKRVSLPFIFGRYCLPKMREMFDGKIELYHIFHDLHTQHGELESSRDYTEDSLENVRQFIEYDLFSEAIVISHRESSIEHLALPSFKMALEMTIQRDADFHLWMEDDAIIFDKECNLWEKKLGDADVGLYRDTRSQKMINTAFFLSRGSFDRRMLKYIKNYHRDSAEDYSPFGSQIEYAFWSASKSQAVLKAEYAKRHHPYGKWRSTISDVKRWLKGAIPEISEDHLDYLRLDFAE